MRLVMVLLVKNEEDIIEHNIRFHAAQGVDAFMVMDNNSDDATPDILKRLASEFEICIIHNDSMEYKQAEWMTSMGKLAGKQMKADLVINNDADEFWSTTDGVPLKNKLSMKDSVVTVKRYNYILNQDSADQQDAYLHCTNRVANPINYDVGNYLLQEKVILPLQRISPKTIVNPAGLRLIKGGNHRAKHWFFWRDRFCADIIVEHYPIRSYQQFEKNIMNRKAIVTVYPDKKMSPHYQRWLSCLEQGRLRDEYRQMLVNDNEQDVLRRFGVIEEHHSALSQWASSLNK